MPDSSSTPLVLAGMVALFSASCSFAWQHRALVIDLVAKNQLMQAFVASSVFGAMSFSFITIGRMTWGMLREVTFASVTITSKDENFEKVVDFVGKQARVDHGALLAKTQKKKKTWKDWRQEFLMGKRTPPKMDFVPANNNDVHIFTYGGRRIVMTRVKGETITVGFNRTPLEMETLTLSAWKGGNSILKQLVNDAIAASFIELSEEMTIFVLSGDWFGGWEKALSKKPRPLESVILDEDLAEGLVEDAREFLGASEWYASVGIPYRRGYLLHGPPGCGKTSFCQALAGELKLDVCMLTLANKNLDDNGLAENLREAPSNAIVLLEDVDAVFVDRAVQTGANNDGVTFSGLLNAIDGVASQEGRLFFMTTNHLDKLDPALVRPGRCDVKVELRKASHKQATQLFDRFYPKDDRAWMFASALPEFEISMAQLQGYLLEHKKDPDSALAHLPRLLEVSKPPVAVDRMTIYEHLRRVGLERWASTFEHHGYFEVADVAGMSIDTVKKWSGELRIDDLSARRMDLLLKADASLMLAYQLADMATIKEAFIQTFVPVAAAATAGSPHASRKSTPSELGSRRSSRQVSDGLKRIHLDITDASQVNRLADQLCAVLQHEGKGIVSIWQLRRHLRIFEHSVAECISAAPAIVAPRPPESHVLCDDVSVYDWLRRACLEHLADDFEAKGYKRAQQLYNLPEATLKDELGVSGQDLTRLNALVNALDSKPDILLSFTLPERPRFRDMFAQVMAGKAEGAVQDKVVECADKFAEALCDARGHGIVSIAQVERFLQGPCAAQGSEHCVAMVTEELVHARRKVAEPAAAPKVPTEWVYGWLKEEGLEDWACNFIDQRMCTRSDLLAEPRLDLQQLASLGVDKAGDQRRILSMIAKLDASAKGQQKTSTSSVLWGGGTNKQH